MPTVVRSQDNVSAADSISPFAGTLYIGLRIQGNMQCSVDCIHSSDRT